MNDTVMCDIEQYIDFLRSHGYMASVSCFDKIFSPFLPRLYVYEVHTPLICTYMKNQSGTFKLCIRNKRLLRRRLPEKPYYECCYAGVEEYVIPIVIDGKTRVVIHVSGYCGKLKKAFLRRKKYAGIFRDECFDSRCKMLNEAVPELSEILKAVRPLQYMFRALYDECTNIEFNNDNLTAICNSAINYICDNYMNDLSPQLIAQNVNYSVSYLRSIFKQKIGMNLSQYIRGFRLQKAAYLLNSTDMSITQIALDVGFDSANYFSTAFLKHYGVSPKKFRDTRYRSEANSVEKERRKMKNIESK